MAGSVARTPVVALVRTLLLPAVRSSEVTLRHQEVLVALARIIRTILLSAQASLPSAQLRPARVAAAGYSGPMRVRVQVEDLEAVVDLAVRRIREVDSEATLVEVSSPFLIWHRQVQGRSQLLSGICDVLSDRGKLSVRGEAMNMITSMSISQHRNGGSIPEALD